MRGHPAVPAIVCGGLVAALGLALAQPAPGAGDQAELATVAWSWGVAHPTGYPLWTLLAHGWLALSPGQDPAQGVARLSALFAGLATALTVEVGGAFGSRRAGAAAGLFFVLSPVAWAQATQAEVYPLAWVFQALEVLALRSALTAASPRRWLAVAAITGGLGATHHLMIGLLVPAALLAVWTRRAALRRADLAILPALALAPLALYALLLWRAAEGPTISWHRIGTMRDLWVHASGSLYAPLLRPTTAIPGSALAGAFGGPVPLAVAGLGAVLAIGALAAEGRILTVFLACALAFGWNYRVSDQDVFFLPAAWAASLLAMLAVERLAARVPLAALLLLALPATRLVDPTPFQPSLAAHDLDIGVLEAAPAGAIAYLTGPDGFTLLYPTLVRGLRPDLDVVDGNLEARGHYPEVAEDILRRGFPDDADPGVWVLQRLLASGRPLALHPRSPPGPVVQAGGVRLKAGAVDLVETAGPPRGRDEPSCGDVAFGDVTLARPCPAAAAIAPLGVVRAPLTWTRGSAGAPLPDLVVVDAAAGASLAAGAGRAALQAPLGMGRPAELLPTGAAWTDPLWVQVPRDTPAGRRALWLGVRAGGAWVPPTGAGTPTEGPFVQLVAYEVAGETPGLWRLPKQPGTLSP